MKTGEAEELHAEFGEPRYLRLGIDSKVYYITKAEVMAEEVLARPKVLTDQDILLSEWNYRVKRAEQLKKRISVILQMMRDDEQRPSRYQVGYDALWDKYRGAITDLRELDAESVNEFRDKVVAWVKELEVRINNLCDNWDPDYFDYFERVLASYEKNHDLVEALQPERA